MTDQLLKDLEEIGKNPKHHRTLTDREIDLIDWSEIYNAKQLARLRCKLKSFRKRVPKSSRGNFTLEDALRKIWKHPFCCVTGKPINVKRIQNFSFDHIVPVANGGSGKLKNLGICHIRINELKGRLTGKHCMEMVTQLIGQNRHINQEIQKKANKIARKHGYLRATKIVFGDTNQLISHTNYGYRKKTTGEYVGNAYRNKFGWKNTYYQRAETVVELSLQENI